MSMIDKLDLLKKNLDKILDSLGDRHPEFKRRLDSVLASFQAGNSDAALKGLESIFSDFECIRECVGQKARGASLALKLQGTVPPIIQLEERQNEQTLAQRVQEICHNLDRRDAAERENRRKV